MAPCQRLSNCKGGAPGASSSIHFYLFRWESEANFFDLAPLEVRNEIIHLEARGFGDRKYHSDSEIGGSSLKRVPNLEKFRKRRLHLLHSITLHC